MKRIIILLFVAAMVCIQFSCALSEEETSGGLFGSIGSFSSSTWKDVSDWAENVWNDVSSWVDNAWGDASEWVTKAWNDSSEWISDIWGDASSWAAESYDSVAKTVNTWWIDTFDAVTTSAKDKWIWFKQSVSTWDTQAMEFVRQIKDSLHAETDDSEKKIHDTFTDLLDKLNIRGSDADKVWETIRAYAEQKGISPILAEKLTLPYLLQLAVDSSAESSGSIPAIAVAQYLTAVIEKEDINSDETADQLVDELKDILDSI